MSTVIGIARYLPLGIAVGVGLAGAVFVFSYFKNSKKSKNVLLKDPQVKYSVKLVDKVHVSHDTRRFRFMLHDKDQSLGLPVGTHIYLSARINGELVIRPYTPTSSDSNIGYFDLVVKVYFKTERFPNGGKMGQHLEAMNLGDYIDIRGPSGLLKYEGNGKYMIKADKRSSPVPRKALKIGMIAGGTGITPMLQIIRDIFKNESDPTEIWLVYANQTPSDILLRDELEDLEASYRERFHLWFTVDRSIEYPNWKYDTGFVTETMLKEHMPGPGDGTLVMMCGPPPMVKFACRPNLNNLGYDEQMLFEF